MIQLQIAGAIDAAALLLIPNKMFRNGKLLTMQDNFHITQFIRVIWSAISNVNNCF